MDNEMKEEWKMKASLPVTSVSSQRIGDEDRKSKLDLSFSKSKQRERKESNDSSFPDPHIKTP
jgi:hypothetical protein